MYAYSPANRTAKYYPKVYIGPSKTIGQLWIYEDKIDTSTTPPTTIKIPEISGWPQSYQQVSQKGEDYFSLVFLCCLSNSLICATRLSKCFPSKAPTLIDTSYSICLMVLTKSFK